MVELLSVAAHSQVRPLFTGDYLSLIIDSVIAGNSTGQIWVDDAHQPQTALLCDSGHSLYLVGAADQAAINQQLSVVLAEQVIAPARQRGIDGMKLLYSQAAWEDQIDVLFPTHTLPQYPRVVYSLGQLAIPEWRSRLPVGYAVSPIDHTLLGDDSLGNRADLIEEIELCWPSQAHFLAHGFGFCVVGDGQILCRCTAEYVSPGRCGIGIATAESHRQRGLATITSSAFIEHCVKHGITPYWDAWLRNTPSVATAETIGLRRIHEYNVYLLSLE